MPDTAVAAPAVAGGPPPSERLRALIAEGEALSTRAAPLSPDEQRRLTALVDEGAALRAQITADGALRGLRDWAGSSAGALPLAAPGAGPVEAARATASNGAAPPPMVVSGMGGRRNYSASGDPRDVQATLQGLQEAGFAVVRQGPVGGSRGRRSLYGVELLEDEGPGYVDDKTLRTIGSAEYGAAFRDYVRGRADGSHLRTLQEGIDTQGGYLVPEEMLNRIIAKEPAPTMLNTYVTQLQTSRDALSIPKVNYQTNDIYTTGIRATWTGEIPASATVHRVTDPQFGQLRIPVYTAMLSLPLTNDLIEDSAFPLLSWASGKFAETIDLLRDDMIMNGTGMGQPAGILANPGGTDQPAISVSGDATTLLADNLVGLPFDVPPQYAANLRWAFNTNSTAKAIAQMKDGNDRYLWGLGVDQSGLGVDWQRRTLMGVPVTYTQFAPNIAANAFPIVFGDFSGYYLVNRVGFSIQVLRELYAETNQVLLLGRVRFGGVVAEPWRLRVVRVST